ncbi:hypothetical protein [Chelativorans sp. AA-79]|uniref:hypothetical protein n=1 Tax=Chelativorans sp. AA-79 TaxID=3028735 RepID=UPI0023F9FB2C|nr:hypothetical protein [Chelativorans sp. AA-79]WEX10329.1 hypothetical protein PVE73_05045 [Chelativorans sp. AA-79]
MNAIERYEAESRAIQKQNRELRRIEQRARIREAVRQFQNTQFGLMRYLSAYPVSTSFLSTTEASKGLRDRYRYELGLLKARDWKAKPERFEDVQARWIVARYFRRFGKAIWLRHAA